MHSREVELFGYPGRAVSIVDRDFHRIKVHTLALRLTPPSATKPAPGEKNTNRRLTSAGERYLTGSPQSARTLRTLRWLDRHFHRSSQPGALSGGPLHVRPYLLKLTARLNVDLSQQSPRLVLLVECFDRCERPTRIAYRFGVEIRV